MYVETFYCEGRQCEFERDLERCCEIQAFCTTIDCPAGWVHTWNASVSLCLGPECNLERDLDLCCDERGVCEQDYSCPLGYVAKPGPVWCANIECEVATDLPNCCDNAMPCTNLTCPENYVQRPNTYCSLAKHLPNACTLGVDKDMCCERGMALQWYRFHPKATKDYRAFQVQLSEFNLYFYGVLVEFSKMDDDYGAIAFSVDGDYPDRENPMKAIDEDTKTKWLDADPDPKWREGEVYKFKALTIQLPKAMPMDHYSFHTANDIPERDPISWTVEGSPDNKMWVTLANVTDARDQIPDEREVETPRFDISVPCFLPLPVHIAHSNATAPCLEGDIVSSGQVCTASCEEGYTPSIASLLCAEGALAPRSFICAPATA